MMLFRAVKQTDAARLQSFAARARPRRYSGP